MTVYDLVEQMLLVRPSTNAVYLAADLYDRHVREQADDLIGRGVGVEGIAFYVEGTRVVRDLRLKAGAAELGELPAAWPE